MQEIQPLLDYSINFSQVNITEMVKKSISQQIMCFYPNMEIFIILNFTLFVLATIIQQGARKVKYLKENKDDLYFYIFWAGFWFNIIFVEQIYMKIITLDALKKLYSFIS